MLFDFDEEAAEVDTRSPGDEIDAQTDAPVRSDNWFYGLVGLLVGVALALVAVIFWPRTSGELTQADIDASVEAALDDRASEPGLAAQVFDQIGPSLVVVRASDQPGGIESSSAANIGSGVVINDQGQILTANHVVESAATIELLLPDGTRVSAQVLNSDPDRDIAVLEITGPSGPLTPAVLGNSRTIQIGDPIYTVGNPFGLVGSMSAGVVSGLGRTIPFPGQDDRSLEDLIQIDAAVNQGSSGGPLLNEQGQVIGIITALVDPSDQGYFIGIGFAVPIDIAARNTADGPTQ